MVRAGGGYAGFNDCFIDLHVDDHPHPIDELYASSEKLRSEPRHPAAWHQASEMSCRVNSANSEWKHLGRLVQLHKLYVSPPDPHDILEIDQALAREVQELLTSSGDYRGGINGSYYEMTQQALRAFIDRENLEERWFEDAHIDRRVLTHLRTKVKGATDKASK